jgi:hypothetical protein
MERKKAFEVQQCNRERERESKWNVDLTSSRRKKDYL